MINILLLLLLLLFISIVLVGFSFYQLYRNEKVYRYRTNILHENIDLYNTLPEYKVMMNNFWVWPLSKFLNKGE